MSIADDQDEDGIERRYDALPDSTDFRDLLFTPTLVEVSPRVELEGYLAYQVPVLDQGSEGACTGFALATVANYLLRRRRAEPDTVPVSPRMLYEMAKRYDEWPGEEYPGSSPRGAMKGWHKHGICSDELWPYQAGRGDRQISEERALNATNRPLGAYYRVNHKDLVGMHSALVEVGILFATALVHRGWLRPDKSHHIQPDPRLLGAHTFVIVAYDEQGFWIQNSWGCNWGKGGFALLYYDDWLEHGTDVWVARLGAAIRLHSREAMATALSSAVRRSQPFSTTSIQSHIISIGGDGQLGRTGTYATSEADVEGIIDFEFFNTSRNWEKKRLMIYAHGGLTSERAAVEQIASYRPLLIEREIYPVGFIWRTDYWLTLKNILTDALSRRLPEGVPDVRMDFVRDRLDDALEPLARTLSGKLQWDEMKENGFLATKYRSGAGRIFLKHLAKAVAEDKDIELHFVAHSAGSIFLAPLIQLLTTSGTVPSGPLEGKRGHGCNVASCTLWAPAITIDLFKKYYLPAIRRSKIERFVIFTLTDDAEQDDDCAGIYQKSLLYLISNALEQRHRIPQLRPDGEPLLGMQKFIEEDETLMDLFKQPEADWVLTPNTFEKAGVASRSHCHGDFDNDEQTLHSTIARILGK